MSKLKNITVLMGGPSEEREVSLRSGAAVAQALKEAGYNVTPVTVDGQQVNLPPGADLTFVCLHGTFGEDGQLQRILAKSGVPFTGSNEATSRNCFDKVVTKSIFIDNGLPTPRSQLVANAKELTLPLPIAVKPPCQGSSVGVSLVFNAEDVKPAIDEALKYGERALVEMFIKGRELTISILDDKALPVIEIRPKHGFYDYKNKYTSGATEYICPAPLDAETAKRVQHVALQAHQALGCGVYSRVDVILADDGQPYLLEINTVPGMTATSLLPKAAKAEGMTFPQLCSKIAEDTYSTFK
jgi:D-alanine-D-alanine ligase